MVELPVDQGYAWAVAAGCFICMFWSYGIYNILGMVLIEVVEHYHASSAISSLMFGIFNVCSLIAMFVHMFLHDKVSDRVIACIGGILFALSLILINCLPNIYLFIFLFGITLGFGFYGVTFSTMITLGHYMKERLNLVSGVVIAAGGLGQLVLPHLFGYFLSEYDIKGAFLILGGCILNILVGASLFRPKSYYERINENLKELPKNKSAENTEHFHYTANSMSLDDFRVGTTCEKDDKGVDNPSFSHDQTSDNTMCNTDKFAKQYDNDGQSKHQSNTNDIHTGEGSIQTIEVTPGNDQVIDVTKKRTQLNLRETVLILCKSRTFLLFNAGRVLSLVAYYLSTLFFPPYLKSLGFGLSSVSFLMSVVGIMDIPAKVFHGWATSFRKIDAAVYTGLSTILANVIIGVCVLLPSYASQIGIAVTAGSVLSVNSGLLNVLLMDCTGLELFPKALVLSTISRSIFMAGLTILYGWLYDVTGSYFIQMCITSISGVLGGVITIIEAKTRQPI